ncbi:hypothetical protein N0V82_000046 [Gnomoniopsis sp. IMI 355080]|nr:hypothetical protein N0V82_000046 [Gnomoniopsis sp. IMI 355080]
MGDCRSPHLFPLRTPSVESLTSIEEPQQCSLDTTASEQHFASDGAVCEEATPPRPSKRARLMKDDTLYTPDIDPLAAPGPLPSPMVLAKKLYFETSCAYIERKMGNPFSKIGPRPAKLSSVDWPKDANEEDTKKMEAWSKKEARWAKAGIPVKHRAPWSFRHAPKNIQQTKTWLRSHGKTRAAAALPFDDDRPLQRPGYVTEYSEETEEVIKLKKQFKPHPGALRVDEQNFESLVQGLVEFAAVKNFKHENEFDYENDIDNNPPPATKRILKITQTPTSKKISVTKSTPAPESYVARMLRIKSHPPNETIEYEDRIDMKHDGSIKEATEATKYGDVSGASVPSERWNFNKNSQRASAEQSSNEVADFKLAALALMELSLQYNRELSYSNSVGKP